MLSYHELVELVDAGVISNCDPENIGPASIDIRLGSWIKKESSASYNRHTPHKINLRENKYKGDYIDLEMGLGGEYTLDPHEFILGHSVEVFNLPNDIVATCTLRSSHQRAGLLFLGGFCDPGWTNSVFTFPLMNTHSYHGLVLSTDLKIAQMVFHRVAEVPHNKSYFAIGRYNNTTGPTVTLGTNGVPAEVTP